MFFYDLSRDPKAQPGTHVAFGGEERLEDLGAIYRSNTGAIVGKEQDHAIPILAQPDVDPARPAARIDGVGEEIRDHLFHLAGRGNDLAARSQLYLERNAFLLGAAAKELGDAVHDRRQFQDLWRRGLTIEAQRLFGD